jgi:two-component system, sensor histidine kinase PdtaS
VKRTLQHFLARHAGGLGVFAAALSLRFQIDGALPEGFPFLTFFPAVVVTAFVLGTGPAIVSAALGLLASWYFFIQPFESFAISGATALALGFYIFMATVSIAIIDRLNHAKIRLQMERETAMRLADENQTRFAEAHHRIGNNLQAISSLLIIQSRSISDPAAKRALMDSVQRIGAIADIQRQFNDMRDQGGLFDQRFVMDLAKSTIELADLGDKFDLTVDIDGVTLDPVKLTAVALVMLECVNNSLEHAVPPNGKCMLHIALKNHENQGWKVLTITDNGPGVPESFDLETTSSIGMKVISAFSHQIKGNFSIRKNGGTVCRLEFPV